MAATTHRAAPVKPTSTGSAQPPKIKPILSNKKFEIPTTKSKTQKNTANTTRKRGNSHVAFKDEPSIREIPSRSSKDRNNHRSRSRDRSQSPSRGRHEHQSPSRSRSEQRDRSRGRSRGESCSTRASSRATSTTSVDSSHTQGYGRQPAHQAKQTSYTNQTSRTAGAIKANADQDGEAGRGRRATPRQRYYQPGWADQLSKKKASERQRTERFISRASLASLASSYASYDDQGHLQGPSRSSSVASSAPGARKLLDESKGHLAKKRSLSQSSMSSVNSSSSIGSDRSVMSNASQHRYGHTNHKPDPLRFENLLPAEFDRQYFMRDPTQQCKAAPDPEIVRAQWNRGWDAYYMKHLYPHVQDSRNASKLAAEWKARNAAEANALSASRYWIENLPLKKEHRSRGRSHSVSTSGSGYSPARPSSPDSTCSTYEDGRPQTTERASSRASSTRSIVPPLADFDSCGDDTDVGAGPPPPYPRRTFAGRGSLYVPKFEDRPLLDGVPSLRELAKLSFDELYIWYPTTQSTLARLHEKVDIQGNLVVLRILRDIIPPKAAEEAEWLDDGVDELYAANVRVSRGNIQVRRSKTEPWCVVPAFGPRPEYLDLDDDRPPLPPRPVPGRRRKSLISVRSYVEDENGWRTDTYESEFVDDSETEDERYGGLSRAADYIKDIFRSRKDDDWEACEEANARDESSAREESRPLSQLCIDALAQEKPKPLSELRNNALVREEPRTLSELCVDALKR
ncbi:hypothetical protein PMZ80_000750 [Knufia obscura]|uniref:Uncharacterized protein n=1 Tax=Knufia obscura TaxID=1635080 RepID=A0ABR0S158_9EURO|nr:hypothetical protein PMZ80_000750 [Knufia obscura]